MAEPTPRLICKNEGIRRFSKASPSPQAAKQRETKHPPERERGASAPVHPLVMIVHREFLDKLGVADAVLGADGEALPSPRCHLERSEASPGA